MWFQLFWSFDIKTDHTYTNVGGEGIRWVFGVLFHDLPDHIFEVYDGVFVWVLIESIAEFISEEETDDEELLEGGVGFVDDEIEGDLEEEVAFGELHEFVFDFLDGVFIVGLGSVVVEELIDERGELEGLFGGEGLWGLHWLSYI